jgi:hypothetical protein
MHKLLISNLLSSLALLLSASAALSQTAAPVYATPQLALESFVAAIEKGDADAAIRAVDPAARDLVKSEDPTATAEAMKDLLALYRVGYRFVPEDGDRVTIALGDDAWPFPVSLLKGPGGWSFDTATAREEVRNREIGAAELGAIDILRTYVNIQATYRKTDHDGDGVLEFAAALISSEGQRDGLYWPGGDSPVGDVAARASLDGYSVEGADITGEPLGGYYFRVLDAQGPSAAGGTMSYLVNGNMLAGHAALAVPAEYGVSGINSFMVSEIGTVYQADLGPNTLEAAFGLTAFDPGPGWQPVE